MARKDVEPIQIHVPRGARAKLKRYANKNGIELSAYIRGLIEDDLKAHGEDINLDIGRTAFKGEIDDTDDPALPVTVLSLAA